MCKWHCLSLSKWLSHFINLVDQRFYYVGTLGVNCTPVVNFVYAFITDFELVLRGTMNGFHF